MNNLFLVEDHDEVLKIWRRQNIKGLDLVHLDAHIDFGLYPARPIEKLINQAKSIKDLKISLERALNFLHYEKDFNKQVNIGNYIYPAMDEGIVNNFYWVIPGGLKEFKKSSKTVKNILKGIARYENNKRIVLEDSNGMISAQCLGRNFLVCTLDNLPVISGSALLDIDTDFLFIDTILNTDNIKNIEKRKPWILPQDLTGILREKMKSPKIITIAYSVNGGFTPIKYKHLGDELAYRFCPLKFKRRFEINNRAAQYFQLFDVTGKKQYYQKSARLNPAYRSQDNNYGPLYLLFRKFSPAKKEFSRILRVDQRNPGAHLGLGKIALEKKEFKKAKRRLLSAVGCCGNNGAFNKIKQQVLFYLAKAEINLGDFKRAKERLFSYKAVRPLDPEGYYLLGRIFEKEKGFPKAAIFYKDALRLGMPGIEVLFRLLRVSARIKDKDEIIKFVRIKYKFSKRQLNRLNKLPLKEKKKSGLIGLKKKCLALEKKLKGGEC